MSDTEKKRPCAGCGTEMYGNITQPGMSFEATAVGVSISIINNAAPRHEHGTYEFCYSCWLESLGIEGNK